MNLNIHTPERVEGETFEEYKRRRAVSNKIAGMARPVFVLNGKGSYATDALRQSTRALSRDVGARQAKKQLRKEKESK